uniref:Ig-like domain-containing protein n=1 Tax=Shewanella sp. TaxID=50422 RepID=UPI0040484B66
IDVKVIANDGTTSVSDTFTLTVTNTNDAPVAAPVTATGLEDAASIAVTLTGSDVDAFDSVISFTLKSLPDATNEGTLYDLQNAAVVDQVAYTASGDSLTLYFVPVADFNGPVTFDYEAYDGTASSALATATINVTPVSEVTVTVDPLVGTQENNNGLVLSGTVDGADSVDVSFTAADGSTQTVSASIGSANTTWTATLPANSLASGVTNLFVEAFDSTSSTSKSVSANVEYDPVHPTLTQDQVDTVYTTGVATELRIDSTITLKFEADAGDTDIDVVEFDIGQFYAAGQTVTPNFVSATTVGTSGVWTYDLAVPADGRNSQVAQFGVRVTDDAGNVSDLVSNEVILLDNARPTITSVEALGDTLRSGTDQLEAPVQFKITFSEPVFGLEATHFNLSATGNSATFGANPTLVKDNTVTNGSVWIYSAVATATQGSEGTIALSLDVSHWDGATTGVTVTDQIGNAVIGADLAGETTAIFTASTAEHEIDTVAPTVAITSDVAALKIGETATITFTFSEAPTGFDADDVTVTGGTLGAITGTGLTRTATFTPTADSTAAASITVGTGYTDAAGNAGVAGATQTIAIDTIAPSVLITSDVAALKAGETATITFTFSEAPTGFDADDVTVTGGTLGAITGTGLTRTATFTPTADSTAAASITVGTGYTDAAGNAGGVGATPTITLDFSPPSLVGFELNGSPVSQTAVYGDAQQTIKVTFDEPVVLPANATDAFKAFGGTIISVSSASGGGADASYNVVVQPDANHVGNLVLHLVPGTITDQAGNSMGGTQSPMYERFSAFIDFTDSGSDSEVPPAGAHFGISINGGQVISVEGDGNLTERDLAAQLRSAVYESGQLPQGAVVYNGGGSGTLQDYVNIVAPKGTITSYVYHDNDRTSHPVSGSDFLSGPEVTLLNVDSFSDGTPIGITFDLGAGNFVSIEHTPVVGDIAADVASGIVYALNGNADVYGTVYAEVYGTRIVLFSDLNSQTIGGLSEVVVIDPTDTVFPGVGFSYDTLAPELVAFDSYSESASPGSEVEVVFSVEDQGDRLDLRTLATFKVTAAGVTGTADIDLHALVQDNSAELRIPFSTIQQAITSDVFSQVTDTTITPAQEQAFQAAITSGQFSVQGSFNIFEPGYSASVEEVFGFNSDGSLYTTAPGFIDMREIYNDQAVNQSTSKVVFNLKASESLGTTLTADDFEFVNGQTIASHAIQKLDPSTAEGRAQLIDMGVYQTALSAGLSVDPSMSDGNFAVSFGEVHVSIRPGHVEGDATVLRASQIRDVLLAVAEVELSPTAYNDFVEALNGPIASVAWSTSANGGMGSESGTFVLSSGTVNPPGVSAAPVAPTTEGFINPYDSAEYYQLTATLYSALNIDNTVGAGDLGLRLRYGTGVMDLQDNPVSALDSGATDLPIDNVAPDVTDVTVSVVSVSDDAGVSEITAGDLGGGVFNTEPVIVQIRDVGGDFAPLVGFNVKLIGSADNVNFDTVIFEEFVGPAEDYAAHPYIKSHDGGVYVLEFQVPVTDLLRTENIKAEVILSDDAGNVTTVNSTPFSYPVADITADDAHVTVKGLDSFGDEKSGTLNGTDSIRVEYQPTTVDLYKVDSVTADLTPFGGLAAAPLKFVQEVTVSTFSMFYGDTLALNFDYAGQEYYFTGTGMTVSEAFADLKANIERESTLSGVFEITVDVDATTNAERLLIEGANVEIFGRLLTGATPSPLTVTPLSWTNEFNLASFTQVSSTTNAVVLMTVTDKKGDFVTLQSDAPHVSTRGPELRSIEFVGGTDYDPADYVDTEVATFRITFDQKTILDDGDLLLTTTASGAQISGFTTADNGKTYEVTVTGLGGFEGNVRLGLKSDSNASNGVGNIISNPDEFTAEVKIDNVDPTFTSAAPLAVNEIDELNDFDSQDPPQLITSKVIYDAGATDFSEVTYSLKEKGTLLQIDRVTGAVSANPDSEDPATIGAVGKYSFTVVATDAAGNQTEQAVVIDVNDLNDNLPTLANAGFNTGEAPEDADSPVSFYLLSGAGDADAFTTTVTLVPGSVKYSVDGSDPPVTTLPAGVSFNTTTSTVSVDPSHSSFQNLSAGVERKIIVNYQVTDGENAVDATYEVTITGTNDAPVLTSTVASLAGAVTEAGIAADGSAVAGVLQATGTLAATDV